jgi:hypothetical protein
MLKGLFQQRSAVRDRDNDVARAERIVRLLAEVRSELEQERKGLRERYDRTVGNASALSFAIDGEGASDWSDRKLKDLESGMVYCEKRTRSIARFDEDIAELQGGAEKLLQRLKNK